MSFGNKIIGGLVWGQIGMSGRTAICFAISILVARSLGVKNYGVYAALISLIDALIKATEMGMQSIVGAYVPRLRSRGQVGECSYLIRQVTSIRGILLVAVAALMPCLTEPAVSFTGEEAVRYYLPFTSLWFLARGLMDGFIFIVIANMEMKFYTAVELLVSVLQLAGVLVLIRLGMTIDKLVVLMIVVNAIQMVAYAGACWPLVQPAPTKLPLRPIVRFGLVTWLSTMLQYFRFKSIDVFMIIYFLKDARSVAYYDIAYLIVMTGGFVFLSSLDRLILPIFSEAHAQNGLAGLREIWPVLTKMSIFLSAPIMMFLIAHADSIVHAFYSDRYAPSAALIKVYAVFCLSGFLLGSETAITVVFPLNKEHLFLYLRGGNGIMNLLLNCILIPRYGVMGAVLATGGTILLSTVFELGLAMRLANVRVPWGFNLKFLAIAGLSLSWTLAFDTLNIAQILLLASVYALTVTALTLRFCGLDENDKKLLREFHPGLFGILGKYGLVR